MLRLAVARSSRRYAPPAARWRRLNSTNTPDLPGKPETGAPSKAAEQSEAPEILVERHSTTVEALKGKDFAASTVASTSILKKPHAVKVHVEEVAAPEAVAAKAEVSENEVQCPAGATPSPVTLVSDATTVTQDTKSDISTIQVKEVVQVTEVPNVEEIAQVVEDTKPVEISQVEEVSKADVIVRAMEAAKAEEVVKVAEVTKTKVVQASSEPLSLASQTYVEQPTVVVEDVASETADSISLASVSAPTALKANGDEKAELEAQAPAAIAEPISLSEDVEVEVGTPAQNAQLSKELKQELEKTNDVEGPTETKPRVAETDEELFGSLAAESEEDPINDPKNLPLKRNPEIDGKRKYTEREWAAALVHGRSIHLPYFHRRTHDIPVANIHFRSHHIPLLDLFTHFATHAASSLGIPTSRVVYLPTQRSMWTVIRSPFAYKKSQENFERKVHKRAIKAWDADPEVVERWVQYLRRHALGGVGMRVVKWNHMSVGVGASRLAHVKQDLMPLVQGDAAKIKELGDQIVRHEIGVVSASKGNGSRV